MAPPGDAPLAFRGGPALSALPLAVFLAVTGVLVATGAPEIEGMIVAAMLGISLGMLFATSLSGYSERVFTLMANRVAAVAIVCWLWAGAFAGILQDSRLVEAIVWLGWKAELTGAGFTVAVFLAASLFAVSVGTGLGTVVGFTAVMYPAGIVLGSDPAALMGAIFSGGALGDNLAPISDTTIVSAATQEADVGGVVRSRLKYVLIAGGISALLFWTFGASGAALDPAEARRLFAERADPGGLPMLIPGALVFLVALRGGHFLAALTAGVAAALVIGPLAGVFDLASVFSVVQEETSGETAIAGSAVRGAMAMVPTAILTLLLVTAIGMMEAGGFLGALLDRLERTFARTARGAEAVIVALISFANLCVSVNTVAMVTVGPLVNRLRKRRGIQNYRAANLLDTVSCSFPYILPYAATMSAATAIQREVATRYPFAEVLPWSQQAPYIFYGLVLFPLMCLAVATGFGHRRG